MVLTPENRDEINAMAEQAGFAWAEMGVRDRMCFYSFATLAAAKERSAILRIIDEIEEPPYAGYENPNTFDDGCIAVADAIRARSQP